MNTGMFITERFAEIATIALHIYFLYRTLDTKSDAKKQVLAGGVFVCVRMAYFTLGFGLRPYFAVISGIFYTRFVFVGTAKVRTIWTIILVTLDGIVDAVVINLCLLFPNASAEQIAEPGMAWLMIILASKGILFLVYYLITREIDKNHTIQKYDCLALLIASIGCWILLNVVFEYNDCCDNCLNDRISVLLLAAGSIVLLLIMSSVIALYNRITANGKELAQSKLQLHTAKLAQVHIDQINDLYEELSTIRHDLKNHFVAISGYLKEQKYSDLEQYVARLADIEIGIAEYVRHPVLNAIIGSRATIAKNEDIHFTASMVLPEILPIPDVDLCILVGNMLDNAFEANEKTTGSRSISLYARVDNSYWVVACRNTTRECGRLRATGSLRSTKEMGGAHGIGTKQIQKIAEKTGGFVTYRHENYEFFTLVTIILPLNDSDDAFGSASEEEGI